MNVIEINVLTGERTERLYTEAEIAELQSPQESKVPATVTRFQARAALHLNQSLHEGFTTMLDEVEAFMARDDVDTLAKLAWTDAQEFKRQSPTILGIAPLLGLDDDDLDNLFITAAGIDA